MFAFLFLLAAIFIYWICLDGWPVWACGMYATFVGAIFFLLERADVSAMSAVGMAIFNVL